MSGPISVGSVVVNVIPTTKGIEKQLAAQVEPAAGKVGDQAGQAIGDGIKRKVAGVVADAVSKDAEKAKAAAADQGGRVGGAFADSFKARLEAAFKSLPKATVDADAGPAAGKVAELRAALEELSGKRVGVDIDAADALARMAEIRRQLTELKRGGDVDLRVDAAKALAELDAVTAEVDKLDGKTARAKVEVDAGDALSAIRAVVSDLAGVSGIAVKASLGVAVAGLGAGGVAAGLGLGAAGAAALPGLSAVRQAFTAQTAAAQAATVATVGVGQSSIQAAQQALSEAGAQQSLAAAVRQASYAHTQALQQVQAAEQSLANAQQQSLNAQKAVNQARKQAKQDLEDLGNQVKDAALAQRQDQLSLTQATQALQAVQANPHATEQQREQAQLAYDQAVQQLSEQGLAYQRLQDQAAAAAKAGVDGAAGVISAQQQQTAATQQLKNAQQALADARANVTHVEQQSADAIASAQRQVLSVQLQAAAAAQGSSTAQATAAAKAKAMFDALAPSEKAVYTAALGLKTAFTGWAQALEPEVLPLFTNGLSLAAKILPGFTPLVRGAAGALGTLETKSSAALGSPVWKKFAADVGKESGPAILGFGVALGHVATGVIAIVDAVLPYAPRMITLLDQTTGKFSSWGQSLGGNSQFHQLVSTLIADAPQLVTFLEQVAKSAGTVATDLAPLAGTTLSVDTEIIKLIGDVASFSPGLLQFGVAVYAANKALSPMVTGARTLIGGKDSGLTGIYKAFKTGGDEGSKFGGVLVKAKGWLSTAAGNASEAAKGGWGRLSGVLSSGADAASTYGGKLLGAAKNAGTAVASGLSSAAGVVAAGATAAGTAAVDLGRAGIAWVATGVKAAGAGIAIAATTVATTAASVATKAWTVVQAAFNLVMDANPIILVTLAVAALVAGVIIAYKNSATFRDIVKGAFHDIGVAAQWVWHNVLDPVFQFFEGAVKRIPDAFDAAVSGVKTAFNKIAGIVAVPVNWVIQYVYDDGIAKLWNTVVGAVGLGSLKLPTIGQLKPPKLASGGLVPLAPGPAVVNAPRAIVGEGDPRYPEFVIPTDPQYRARAKALHAAAGTQLLAGGGVLGGITHIAGDVVGDVVGGAKLLAELISDPRGTWDRLTSSALALAGKYADNSWGKLIAQTPITEAQHLGDYVFDIIDAIMGNAKHAGPLGAGLGAAATNAATDVARWAPTVGLVLGQLGIPATQPNISAGLIVIGHESGGNPAAVNRSDINWQHGTPSVGLTQVIGPTFKTWAGPYVKTLPQLYGVSTNPVANMYAGFDYGVHRYHSMQAIPGVAAVLAGKPYVGYDDGGYLGEGYNLTYNGTGKPEPVFTDAQWDLLRRGGADGGGRSTTLYVYPPAASAEDTATEVVRRMQHAGIS